MDHTDRTGEIELLRDRVVNLREQRDDLLACLKSVEVKLKEIRDWTTEGGRVRGMVDAALAVVRNA